MPKTAKSKKSFRARYRAMPRLKRRLCLTYILLITSVLATMAAQTFNGNYSNVFLCLLTLVLFAIPSFIERKIKLDVPDTLEIIILLFIYAAEIIGEIQEFYTVYKGWDTLQHTINGFLMGAIGVSLIDILNNSKRLTFKLSPLFVALFAFCFSMTIGVVWEFFEFGVDMLFAKDMQKDTFVNVVNTVILQPDGRNIVMNIPIESVVVNGEQWPYYIDIGLIDTMRDLLVNFIGALVASVLGFFHVRGSRRNVLRKLLLTKIDDNGGESSDTVDENDAVSEC